MRGGARTKIKPTTSQKALLAAIWHKYGGVGSIAKKIGVHAQAPVNWRLRGRVPLKLVTMVADALGFNRIQTWGLNYSDMLLLFPNETPFWAEVVESYSFPPEVYKSIMGLKNPKNCID